MIADLRLVKRLGTVNDVKKFEIRDLRLQRLETE